MRSRWDGPGRFPAVHRLHHVAALEAQGAVLGARMTRTPSVVPKYWPRSGLSGASSRSPRGEPARNSKRSPGPMSIRSSAGPGIRSSGPGPRNRMANGRSPPGPRRQLSGSSSVITETVFRSLPRRNSIGTVSAGSSRAASSISRSPGSDWRVSPPRRPAPPVRTDLPSSLVMTSPERSPALAAGPLGVTDST